ncbi:MAG TPA: ABC transporter permease [Acidimicrobiales bacterium]|nr:ABC transporter permease [Acidimicrobiales bacterium]
MSGAVTTGALRLTPVSLLGSRRRGLHLVEHNVVLYRRAWIYLVTGFFEPFFYLLSIGLGLGHLVGSLRLGGQTLSYTEYVAPGLLASAAMNGAIIDATFQTFFKLKITRLYDSVLATPMSVPDVVVGELTWTLIRSGLYSGGFLVVMAGLGYVISPWVVLCYPGAILIGYAFSATGMAATSYMRSWQDFDKVSLSIIPLFLFSATFYPLSVYPEWLQWVVRCTPLYQGVALLRGLDAGLFTWSLLGHAVYLAAMGSLGLSVTARRFAQLLLP